jgi:hypothetical protein
MRYYNTTPGPQPVDLGGKRGSVSIAGHSSFDATPEEDKSTDLRRLVAKGIFRKTSSGLQTPDQN